MTDWKKYHSNHFQGTKVLVTGGAGFIGSHITEALLQLGATVTVLDDLSGGDTQNLAAFASEASDRLAFVEGSILDQALLAKRVAGCKYVFHQAALGSVPGSVDRPAHYTEVNVIGTLRVLEASRQAKVNRVMFAASSSAYGDSQVLPKVETMRTQSISPYAATKVACEALLSAYSGSYDLDTAALRYFNIFGPRQNANSAYAAVIAAFAKAISADQHPMIYGDGEQSRDFTFVHNAVHANLLAARCKKRIRGQVINVACGTRVTVNELATMMAQLMGKPQLTCHHEAERAGDVKHSLADMTLAKKLLDYEPIVSFQDGLAPTVEWYESVLC
jgi:nucleoside-diphosphate-sugar epimerase